MLAIDELNKLNSKELELELKRAILELVKLRLSVASRQSKSTANLKYLRRYIARIKTILGRAAAKLSN